MSRVNCVENPNFRFDRNEYRSEKHVSSSRITRTVSSVDIIVALLTSRSDIGIAIKRDLIARRYLRCVSMLRLCFGRVQLFSLAGYDLLASLRIQSGDRKFFYRVNIYATLGCSLPIFSQANTTAINMNNGHLN